MEALKISINFVGVICEWPYRMCTVVCLLSGEVTMWGRPLIRDVLLSIF